MIPLSSSIDRATIESLSGNAIDFTSFSSVCSVRTFNDVSVPTLMLREPSGGKEDQPGSVVAYRWSNASHPVVFLVSPEPKCAVAANFMCNRLVHYLSWIGECCRKYTVVKGGSASTCSSASGHTRAVYGGEALLLRGESEETWRSAMEQTVMNMMNFFASNPPVGYFAAPIAVLMADSGTPEAISEIIRRIRDRDPEANIRVVCFGEHWREGAEQLEAFIDVNLTQQAIRATRSRGSVVCSVATGIVNANLSLLCRIFRDEVGQLNPFAALKNVPPIFFARHGQSQYNLQNRLGGDPDLTASGVDDAYAIGEFFANHVVSSPWLFSGRNEEWEREEGFSVWCSQLRRTRRTAKPAARVLTNGQFVVLKSLNEIHAGICEDMTSEEVGQHFPCIQKFRESNKVSFRYPNGESYLDLMRRLEPLLLELSTTRKCTLVVAHQAVLRTMLSYFGGVNIMEAVDTLCPQRTVWCCTFNRCGEPRLATIKLPTSSRGSPATRTLSGTSSPLGNAPPARSTAAPPKGRRGRGKRNRVRISAAAEWEIGMSEAAPLPGNATC